MPVADMPMVSLEKLLNMRCRAWLVVLGIWFSSPAEAHHPNLFSGAEDDETVGKRSWLIRPCYNRQSELNFVEIGIGRINSLNSRPGAGLNSFTLASIGFTLGADVGFTDSSLIVGTKMGIEGCVTIFGGRVTYGYYQQERRNTGVIGFEGGFCILSVFYAYAGYNFVKGDKDIGVLPEGPKFSIGLNIPLWPSNIPAAKKPDHL